MSAEEIGPIHRLVTWGARSFAKAELCRVSWWLVLVVGLVLAVRSGTLGLAISPEAAYGADFAQEYVLARALLDGIDGYVPMAVLADRYGISAAHTGLLQSPTPHPPPVGLLFLPFASLDYSTAASVWLRLQVVFLAVTGWLLLGTVLRPVSVISVLALTALLLGLAPVADDLKERNIMTLLLVLLAGARFAVLSHRPSLGGALVGLSVLVKPVAWPLLLLFAIRREWRPLRAGSVVLAVGYVATVLVLGFGRLVVYFTQVLPDNNARFAHAEWNFSLWTIGWRVFDGSNSAAPLVQYQPAAALVSVALPTLVLLIACLWVGTQPDFDHAFGVMICVAILVSPVVWEFYVVLAIIPAANLLGKLGKGSLKSGPQLLALALVSLLLILPNGPWSKLAHLLAGQSGTSDATGAPLPFGPSLLLFTPTAALAMLAWLLPRLRIKRVAQTLEDELT